MKIRIFTLLICLIASVHVSAQTFQWRLQSGSPGETGTGRFEDIYFADPNNGWIIDFGGEAFKTTNGGVNWSSNFTASNAFFRSLGFFNVQTGLIGSLTMDSNKVLYRTTNAGINWTMVNLPSPKIRGICGISIVNENHAYACGRYFGPARVIKTSNAGLNWTNIDPDTSLAKSLVDCYFWTPDSGIVVGGYNTSSFEFGNAVVLITTNAGSSWQRVHKTSRTGEWCWKISFISRSIGFVSIERETGFSYILKTTNGGFNWIEIPFRDYDEEGIGFLNENTGWVGGWTGPTYQTTNGGTNWQLAGWGTNVNRFRFLSDTLAYAVGDRVYKYSRGPVGVHSASTKIPSTFNLYQNYPNPFNPVTKIKFDISRDARRETLASRSGQDVKLIVYDELGREVQIIVNENLSYGSYEVDFNSGNLPSGVYFYKLDTDSFSDVKRMILMK